MVVISFKVILNAKVDVASFDDMKALLEELLKGGLREMQQEKISVIPSIEFRKVKFEKGSATVKDECIV